MDREAGDVQLRPARPDETPLISALALRSKGYWGYSGEFLERCRDELTYSPRDATSGRLVVAEADGVLAGFWRVSGNPPEGELAALFVDPPFIGSGMGLLLLRDALAAASAWGFARLVLEADPGAEGFYTKHGAVVIGRAASGSIPGRSLPRLRFDVT